MSQRDLSAEHDARAEALRRLTIETNGAPADKVRDGSTVQVLVPITHEFEGGYVRPVPKADRPDGYTAKPDPERCVHCSRPRPARCHVGYGDTVPRGDGRG